MPSTEQALVTPRSTALRSLFWSAIAVLGVVVGSWCTLAAYADHRPDPGLVFYVVFIGSLGLGLTAWITAGVFFFSALVQALRSGSQKRLTWLWIALAGFFWSGWSAAILFLYFGR